MVTFAAQPRKQHAAAQPPHPLPIAVIGSHADVGVLSGGGSSQVTPPGGPAVPPTCNPEGPGGSACPVWAPSSPLKAIQAAAPNAQVRFADGTDASAAAALAKSSDVAVVFAHEWRRESEDHQSSLPKVGPPEWPTTIDQDALIDAVAGAQRRTVVVLENGGPVTMPWLGKTSAQCSRPGIRAAAASEAIADTLFGDVNPSGKLTVTFPKQAQPICRPGPRRHRARITIPYDERLLVGYRWYDAKRIEPLFPFGFGLSYTRYRYAHLRRHGLRVSFEVTNTGKRAGTEIAQVYAGLPRSAGEPPQRLVGWARVALRPRETRRVSVQIDPKRLAIWDQGWKLARGDYTFSVGASSRDIRLR